MSPEERRACAELIARAIWPSKHRTPYDAAVPNRQWAMRQIGEFVIDALLGAGYVIVPPDDGR